MELTDFDIHPDEDWASFLYGRVITRKDRIYKGNVFVIDPAFGSDAVWKCVSGHKKSFYDKSPWNTVIREFRGETGLEIDLSVLDDAGKPRNLVYLGKVWGFKHWKVYFIASVYEDGINKMHSHDSENEGEIPVFFKPEKFAEIVGSRTFMDRQLREIDAVDQMGILARELPKIPAHI